MKFKIRYFVLVVTCLIIAVIFSRFMHDHLAEERQQVRLTKQLVDSLNNALINTQKSVRIFAEVLKTEFDLNKPCNLPMEDNTVSSVYYPKSAIQNHRTNCFVSASKKLEPLWQKLFQDSGYISWVYAFDSDSKVKRILPAGNVKTLFGENLIFDSFMFYQEAVKSYPFAGWTMVREDISGTGKIIVSTQGIKLPSSKRFVSMSADIRINQILKDKYSEIQTFLQKNDLAHFFVLAYSKEGDNRIVISDFSNDLTQWIPLKPHDNRALNVLPSEEVSLKALETLSNSNPLKIEKHTISLQHEEYLCTQGRVLEAPIFFLVCSRE